jgi:hypothetical protein
MKPALESQATSSHHLRNDLAEVALQALAAGYFELVGI